MPRVLQFDQPGGPEQLLFRDIEAPNPGPGIVRYRVIAFGLNRGDLSWLSNQYYNSPTYPSRIGQEACGVVDAIGSDVTEFRVGDRVSSIPQVDGSYCVNGQFALTPAKFLVPWPEYLSAEQACSSWAQYVTAYFPLVEIAPITRDDFVLVTAGASSAGIGAIQIAKYLGARVIATSRTFEKESFLRGIGADAVIATAEEVLERRVADITGGTGAKIVFDPVTGSLITRYVGAMAKGGTAFLVGALEGNMQAEFPILPLVRNAAAIIGYSIYNYLYDDDLRHRCKTFILRAMQDGIRPVVSQVYPFEQAIEAYKQLNGGNQTGKIVVRVSS
jgi:NADPH:quinone reductase-like Zn-dependent oxidoreductase